MKTNTDKEILNFLFNWRGYCNLLDFWKYAIIMLVLSLGLNEFLDYLIDKEQVILLGLFTIFIGMPFLVISVISSFIICVRRFRSRNYPPFLFTVLSFIPIINIWTSILLFCLPSVNSSEDNPSFESEQYKPLIISTVLTICVLLFLSVLSVAFDPEFVELLKEV